MQHELRRDENTELEGIEVEIRGEYYYALHTLAIVKFLELSDLQWKFRAAHDIACDRCRSGNPHTAPAVAGPDYPLQISRKVSTDSGQSIRFDSTSSEASNIIAPLTAIARQLAVACCLLKTLMKCLHRFSYLQTTLQQPRKSGSIPLHSRTFRPQTLRLNGEARLHVLSNTTHYDTNLSS